MALVYVKWYKKDQKVLAGLVHSRQYKAGVMRKYCAVSLVVKGLLFEF